MPIPSVRFFFFFSSRRRHTRSLRDWSSDVCSSDLRGMVGREKCGLMPIRGHSGVQGGAEMGAVPSGYGLGFSVNDANADRFSELWGFRPPTTPGMTAVGMIDAAHERRLDVLYMAGGNFLETLPEPDYVAEALGRIPLRIHQDLVV